MLDNTDKKNIFIQKFDQEWLPTTILAYWLLIIYESTMLYVKVIADIKCYTWLSIKLFYIKETTRE